MSKNRGKQFEEIIKKAFQKVEGCYIQRLYDPGFGYSGVKNFADFFIFLSPYLIFIECKSVDGGTLNFSRITDNQLKGLEEVSQKKNILGGVLVWFKDKDFTCFIPIESIIKAKKQGLKSISFASIDSFYYILLNGQKKRVLFEYDAESFLELLKEYAKESKEDKNE